MQHHTQPVLNKEPDLMAPSVFYTVEGAATFLRGGRPKGGQYIFFFGGGWAFPCTILAK